MTMDSSDRGSDESIRMHENEQLILCIARLKLRLQACLRVDRDNESYKATLARCLDDVGDIVRAASDLSSFRPRARG
jgi:hypothetical protein